MKEIPLTRGLVALVDDEDYDSLSPHKWYAFKHSEHCTVYAGRKLTAEGNILRMHRIILSAPSGLDVDHVNGDGLDNRRCNLRIATRSQNCHNRGAGRNNKSGYKGVCWHTQAGRWVAQIGIGGKRKHLGLFASPEEAYAVYCAAAKELHGEFARFA